MVGIYGHATRSRALILAGILVIGVTSLYFVAAGEVVSVNR
ncbi:MAG: hypothetical protein ACLP01_13530 [Solirubrobacteraceae bacterium]